MAEQVSKTSADCSAASLLLKKVSFFSTLDIEMLQKVSAVCVWKKFNKGDTVFVKNAPPDGLYIIQDGMVDIVAHSIDGKEIILNILSTYETFGEIALIDRSFRTATARCVTDCRLLFLPAYKWYYLCDLLGQGVQASLAISVCKLLRKTSQRIEEIAFLDAKSRVCSQLYDIFISGKMIEPVQEGVLLKISQDKLARMLGLTREITNKILARFEKDGILARKHGAILIYDIKAILLFISKEEIDEVKLLNMA